MMYTFKKSERLGNYHLQSLLFDKGTSFFQYPFRVQYLVLTEGDLASLQKNQSTRIKSAQFGYPAKVLVSASRRQLKKAVHRNKAKRLIREVYRKNKSALYAFLLENGLYLLIAFIYTANHIKTYEDVDQAMNQAFEKLQTNIMQADR